MSGLDGQVIELYTAGINAPSDGQDGFLAVAEVTATVKNLRYIDPKLAMLGPLVGPALTDASVTIQVSQSNARALPSATLTANRTLTLATTGANTGELIRVSRLDVGAFTFAVVNGGPGGGTLYTFPVSIAREATFVFNGTNWALDLHWAI